ncbi:MAG TPA: NYN domain-containing protein [Aromatoleum sp.]|uniref:NYN domain-containing protein n=1 Tax=Aromatoleum sp. TaxID=2307007 RepID=UPI002B476C95|nr:NYN domain-containing protein [Aromatoleum sp.]HJV28219.1 NYN domain-containing protein [Aromatoleum sp.]
MASSHDSVSMAVFCDFENVALGVRDAKYEKFDIKPVLERLLLKGSIVVKKAYCDWERYKGFKAVMHEANFELIEIPHVRQSGKNSADIRLVVDALDLCYTKSHVNTFVIISGDSDFSPLVSKLRENAKQVIGVGVKQSTSDLLIANCDEFIFYDDLVRESQRTAAKRETRETQPTAKRTPEEEKRRKEEHEARKMRAIEIAVETFEALVSERGDSGGRIWASMLKEAIKRRNPGFNESYYGFRAFGNLLEEAQSHGLLEFGRDDKSGAYVYRSNAAAPLPSSVAEPVNGSATTVEMHAAGEAAAEATEHAAAETPAEAAQPAENARHEPRRKGRGGRKPTGKKPEAQTGVPAAQAEPEVAAPLPVEVAQAVESRPFDAQPVEAHPLEAGVGEGARQEPRRKSRGGRKPTARKAEAAVESTPASAAAEPVAAPPMAEVRSGTQEVAATNEAIPAAADAAPAKPEKAAKSPKKPGTRSRRPRKVELPPDAS